MNITDTLLRIEISAFLKFIFVHTSAVVAYAVTSLICKERFILYASCNHHLVTVIYELTLKGINICLLNKLEIPGLVISKSTSPVDYQRNDRFATHFFN